MSSTLGNPEELFSIPHRWCPKFSTFFALIFFPSADETRYPGFFLISPVKGVSLLFSPSMILRFFFLDSGLPFVCLLFLFRIRTISLIQFSAPHPLVK